MFNWFNERMLFCSDRFGKSIADLPSTYFNTNGQFENQAMPPGCSLAPGLIFTMHHLRSTVVLLTNAYAK